MAAGFAGLWLGRPGFNLRPRLSGRSWLLLLGALVAAGGVAAGALRVLPFGTPYVIDSWPALMRLLPGLFAITAVEEAIFRQGMYRCLERRGVAASTIVATTALIFALGHAGPLFTGRTALLPFHVVQTLYLMPVGWLLGKIRQVTHSWLMSWLAHAAYNLTVLAGLLL